MRLKPNIKEQLMRSIAFRKALADLRNTDTPNVLKLIRTDSELLTTLPVIELIKKHTQIEDIPQLFTTEPEQSLINKK